MIPGFWVCRWAYFVSPTTSGSRTPSPFPCLPHCAHQSAGLAEDSALGLQTPPVGRALSVPSGPPVTVASFPGAMVAGWNDQGWSHDAQGPGTTIPIQPGLVPCGPPAQRSTHPRNALISSVITGSPSCPTPKPRQAFAGRQEEPAVKAGGLGRLVHTQIKWKGKWAPPETHYAVWETLGCDHRSSWAPSSPGWGLRTLTGPPSEEAVLDGSRLVYTNLPVMG